MKFLSKFFYDVRTWMMQSGVRYFCTLHIFLREIKINCLWINYLRNTGEDCLKTITKFIIWKIKFIVSHWTERFISTIQLIYYYYFFQIFIHDFYSEKWKLYKFNKSRTMINLISQKKKTR